MRVIAGTYRGRTLRAPSGDSTRPTTDRVRESLFSTLASLRGGFDDACVLDAFAGSGALGIEALSRGAAYACFCERDRSALSVLEANTSYLDDGVFRVARCDVFRRIPAAPRPYDLVFFDPPYATGRVALAELVGRLDEQGLLAADCILSSERAADGEPLFPAGASRVEWSLDAAKSFGNTAIDIYRRSRS